MAFNSKSREIIRKRANNKSEISGISCEPLQAAHISHRRKTGYYNDPSNGILMTVAEHLMDHILREGNNGLSKSQNYYAISSLIKQVETIYGSQRVDHILEICEDPLKREWWSQKISEIHGMHV